MSGVEQVVNGRTNDGTTWTGSGRVNMFVSNLLAAVRLRCRVQKKPDHMVQRVPSRLDQIHIAGLIGCEAQRKKVAAARPLVCIFGHYHCGYGVEKVITLARDGMWPLRTQKRTCEHNLSE